MAQFNAEEARKLANQSLSASETNELLMEIENAAKLGDYKIFVYKELNCNSINNLQNLGFDVKRQPPISQQKDSLYYIISW